MRDLLASTPDPTTSPSTMDVVQPVADKMIPVLLEVAGAGISMIVGAWVLMRGYQYIIDRQFDER